LAKQVKVVEATVVLFKFCRDGLQFSRDAVQLPAHLPQLNQNEIVGLLSHFGAT
jgi:hypothetical protein